MHTMPQSPPKTFAVFVPEAENPEVTVRLPGTPIKGGGRSEPEAAYTPEAAKMSETRRRLFGSSRSPEQETEREEGDVECPGAPRKRSRADLGPLRPGSPARDAPDDAVETPTKSTSPQ